MMSDQIPFHIQEEIMTRLPVKSLIQFRSVSKAWKSLIDSSKFIAAHTLRRHTQPQHLLVSCQDFEFEGDEEGVKYVCYIDDDSFPQQRSLPTLPPPLSSKQINSIAIGSSRGLVCLFGTDPTIETNMALIWNPTIRKSITVDLPSETKRLGFGVCPLTNDPKIVSITQSCWDEPDIETTVMVYTLSSGKWRSLSTNQPNKHIRRLLGIVVTDGFSYWLAVSETHSMIVSFDVTDECFEAIDLPNSLACHGLEDLYITKLRESLAMIQYDGHDICTVWMMEDGVERSFKKLFNIAIPFGYHDDYILGFRKNGIPMMRMIDSDPDDVDDVTDLNKRIKLVVYEPTISHHNFLEISPYQVNSYTETLLLLGRSDCIGY